MSDFCARCGDAFSASITASVVALRSLANPCYCCECYDAIRQKHCCNCMYFHQFRHLVGTDDGCCRINAIAYYGFPPTTKDNWCGQWKEKQ